MQVCGRVWLCAAISVFAVYPSVHVLPQWTAAICLQLQDVGRFNGLRAGVAVVVGVTMFCGVTWVRWGLVIRCLGPSLAGMPGVTRDDGVLPWSAMCRCKRGWWWKLIGGGPRACRWNLGSK